MIAERTVALYEKILEAVPGGVVYVAHNGNLLLANQQAQDFLGLRLDPDGKRYVSDFATETFNEDGSVCPVEDYPVSRCLATGELQPPRVVGVRHPAGKVRWAVFTALPFHPADGNAPGAVVSFFDITERRQAEEKIRVLQAELAQRERLATVGTLAAAVAHEVNNPLAFILLSLENTRRMLEAHELDHDALRVELDDLEVGAARVRDIVRDLTTFAKIRDDIGDMSELSDVIRTAVRLAAPELRYRAEVILELEAQGRVAASGRLSQVILNLVLNAGRSFETRTGSERIRVTSQIIDDWIVVDVIDNGPGVPPQIVDRIFDPFFTTRDDGSGLGLAVSRSLVGEMGGTLELVERAAPSGACFRISLPRLVAVELDADGKRGKGNDDTVRNVLLVDDEEIIRRIGCVALEPHLVTVAASVAEALEILREQTFDAILCDTMLLDGTGIDVYEWLAENRPELLVRFAFVTGGVFSGEVVQFFERNDTLPVLQKPFSRAELHRELEQLVKTGD